MSASTALGTKQGRARDPSPSVRCYLWNRKSLTLMLKTTCLLKTYPFLFHSQLFFCPTINLTFQTGYPTNTSQVVCSDTILALLHQTCPGPHLYSLLVSSRKTSLLPLTPRPIHPKVHQFLPQKKKKKIELKSTPSCHLHSQ